jgi:hypothetical protein
VPAYNERGDSGLDRSPLNSYPRHKVLASTTVKRRTTRGFGPCRDHGRANVRVNTTERRRRALNTASPRPRASSSCAWTVIRAHLQTLRRAIRHRDLAIGAVAQREW